MFVAGSMRVTLCRLVLAIQTEPAPNVIPPAEGMSSVATTLPAGGSGFGAFGPPTSRVE
jgi:hypothetical protein